MHRTPLRPLTSSRPSAHLLLLVGVLALPACGGNPAPGADKSVLGAGKGALITLEMGAAPGGGPQRLTVFSSREAFILDAE